MSKKLENTTEKTEVKTEIVKKRKKAPIGAILTVFCLLSVFAVIAYKANDIKEFFSKNKEEKALQNQQIPETELITMLDEKADKASLSRLQEQLMNIQAIVNELILQNNKSADVDMTVLNQRIDNLQDLIVASVNGKADAQSVLGVVMRTDKLEKEVERISRLSNEGSILLAATMLVKENAMEGRDFSFEAGILLELVGENSRISEPMRTIYEAAQNGIATKEEIGKEFAAIYADLNKPQEKEEMAISWKDRLNSKLSELVSINNANEEQARAQNEQNAFMSAIKELADEQKYVQIATLVNASDNNFLKEDANLQNWIKKVMEKDAFEAAISKISAYSLTLMKVNNLLAKAE